MRATQVTEKKTRRDAAATAGVLRLCALSLATVALLALSVSPAAAAGTHPLKATFGSFGSPWSVAVDEANGNVFVADAASGSAVGVEVFGADGGAPVGVSAAGSKIDATPSSGRLYVAVDNSPTSPSKDALYVTDPENHAVRKLTLNSGSEEYEVTGTLTADPAFIEPLAIAVDGKGNVYVGGYQQSFLVRFDPAGAEIDRIQLPPSLESGTGSLAFDSAGNLYVGAAFGGATVVKLAANGAGEIETDPIATPIRSQVEVVPGVPIDPESQTSTGIAVDRGTGTLYVGTGRRVVQYDVDCEPVQGKCEPELKFGFGPLASTRGLAVNSDSEDIYVTDGGHKYVALFGGPLVTVPDPVTKPTSDVKLTSATLHGTISAAGGPDAVCEFQYTTKAAFEAEEFEGASTAPCSPAGPFIGTGEEAVSAELSGLDPAAAYFFRLVANNENGANPGETLSFATVGLPQINATFIGQVTLDSAVAEGRINPNGGPNAAVETTYAVEYVSQADFEASGYAAAVKIPAAGKAIGSGVADVAVAQPLTGLAVASTYHYRLVTENEAGKTTGPDKIFATYREAFAGLPDGRAYEQATPVDKNGNAAMGGPGEVEAAVDGSAIVYTGSAIPGAEGAQQLASYLARRGADWSTQGLLPPATGGSVGSVAGWSEDLAQAYVTQGDIPGTPVSFLERDSATRALRAMTAKGSEPADLNYVDTSDDGAVAVFESEVPLTPGSASGDEVVNTYVWDRASSTLRLAGVLNTGLAPAKGTLAGSNQNPEEGGGYSHIALNKHYTQPQHTLSGDGSRFFFRAYPSSQLYVRLNPARAQSPLDAQKQCTDASKACTVQISASKRTPADPLGPKPASFVAASADGSQAFFTSSAKLTDDATTGPADVGTDLYRYEVNGDKLTDLTPDETDLRGAWVQGVVGVSADGSYVYFAANGVLAPGATAGNCKEFTWSTPGVGKCNLYVWHDDTVTFIAPLNMDGGDFDNLRSTNYAGSEKTSRVSADGKTLLFRSSLQLSDYDNEGAGEFYRYDAVGGELLCLSCNPSGAPSSTDPTLRSIERGIGNAYLASVQTRNLSADGKRVFFETTQKLISSDTNGLLDVYEWEAKGSGSCASEAQNGGCLYLISTGTSEEPAYFADASASGDDAFFFTDQRLVGQDRDRIVDIYDARVGGGIASQNPPQQPEPCAGEASCRGAVPPQPTAQSPGTSTFSGPSNPKPSQHKKKKKAHRKKQHKKRHHASRKHG